MIYTTSTVSINCLLLILIMEQFDILDKIDQVKEVFNRSKAKAESYLDDHDKLQVVIEEAFLKGRRAKMSIQVGWEYLQVFYALLKDHITGAVRCCSKEDLVSIVAAMVYFISTVDVFPDFIPLFGYVDDAFVIGLVAAKTNRAVEAYRKQKAKTHPVVR